MIKITSKMKNIFHLTYSIGNDCVALNKYKFENNRKYKLGEKADTSNL